METKPLNAKSEQSSGRYMVKAVFSRGPGGLSEQYV